MTSATSTCPTPRHWAAPGRPSKWAHRPGCATPASTDRRTSHRGPPDGARRLELGPLLADGAVDGLAEKVGVAGVPGGLLQQVQQDPAQREAPAVAERLHRKLVQGVRLGRGLAAPLTGLPVPLAQ